MLYQKILNFATGIFHGLMSIFKMRQKGKFILLSLAIWISYYLAAYLVCFALPETSDFTFADGFFIIVVGTFGDDGSGIRRKSVLSLCPETWDYGTFSFNG